MAQTQSNAQCADDQEGKIRRHVEQVGHAENLAVIGEGVIRLLLLDAVMPNGSEQRGKHDDAEQADPPPRYRSSDCE